MRRRNPRSRRVRRQQPAGPTLAQLERHAADYLAGVAPDSPEAEIVRDAMALVRAGADKAGLVVLDQFMAKAARHTGQPTSAAGRAAMAGKIAARTTETS